MSIWVWAKIKETEMKFKIDIIATQQVLYKTSEEIQKGIGDIQILNEIVRNMTTALTDMRKNEKLGNGDAIDYLEGTVGGISLRVSIEI
jgi:hypothetical protein